MNKLITIIIPMYNGEKYIDRMMNCIKNQTYTNLEIIIINDGSIDNSLEIVKDYARNDNRIKIISTENKGVSNARNLGIESARGDYITFLDIDDYIEYDMYEKMILKMEENGAEAIRCNYVNEDEQGNVILEGNLMELSNKLIFHQEIKEKLLLNIFLNKIPTYVTLLLVKSEIIKEKLKFNTNVYLMEDLLFCLDLYLSINNIYLYDYKCYHYVTNKNSSTKARKNIMKNFDCTLKIVHILENLFRKNNFSNILYSNMYFIYSTMLVKYILRTFQQDDEYQLSYKEFIDLFNNDKVLDIIKKANFSEYNNEYIKKAAEYIQNNEFEKLYKYAIDVKNIVI